MEDELLFSVSAPPLGWSVGYRIAAGQIVAGVSASSSSSDRDVELSKAGFLIPCGGTGTGTERTRKRFAERDLYSDGNFIKRTCAFVLARE